LLGNSGNGLNIAYRLKQEKFSETLAVNGRNDGDASNTFYNIND